jgi:uncharacterized membrane protein
MKSKPLKGETISDQQLKSSLKITESKTDRVTVLIMTAFGSIPFLICCLLFFIFWILWNINILPGCKPFDSYPFPLLEIIVSLFAIILSVTVIINQNRQAAVDKISHQVEFEVNIRAEEEITKILNMVNEIQQRLGVETSGDKELDEMKEPTDIGQIHRTLGKNDGTKSFK